MKKKTSKPKLTEAKAKVNVEAVVIPTDAELMSKTLEQLLKIAESLFPKSKPKLSCYNFDLGYFPYGWKFSVTNSWHKWMQKKLDHEFGIYKDPKFCVIDFLKYVRNNKINVMKLTER
jgi:hypothetical protein